MPSQVSSHLAACLSLAQRFSDVTGGHARAELTPLPGGGVTLRYLQGCPHVAEPHFEMVREESMSLLRAMDSLTTHVGRALKTNTEGLELAALKLDSAMAPSGIVHLHFYCPAWHQTHSLPCKYVLKNIPGGKHVTLELVGPAELTPLQSTGWNQLYDAGIVGPLSRILPLASQALAQLGIVNRDFGLKARTVLLPGEHREYTGFPENGVVLSDFETGPGFWSVYPRGNGLVVDTNEGTAKLAMDKMREMNVALARWQTVVEAVADAVAEND